MNRNIDNERNEFKNSNTYILTKSDFLPPYDDRLYDFGIEDVPNGDSYNEYVKEFWELYEEELFD